MLASILEETGDNIRMAAAWAINAKYLQANIHSFPQLQRKIGQNPNLSRAATSEATALTQTQTNQ